jgi:hypothetical protein
MSDVYVGTGTLSNEKTVTLDRPVPLPPGRVRVTVEPLPREQPSGDLRDRLNVIRETLHASGYHFRSRDEIDAQIQAERESWET